MRRFAVCTLLMRDDGRVLSVSRGPTRLDWGLPGGLVDNDETFQNAALRELREETGIALSTPNVFHPAPLRPVFRQWCAGDLCTTFVPSGDYRAFEVGDASGFEGYVDWLEPRQLVSANCSFAGYNALLFRKLNIDFD